MMPITPEQERELARFPEPLRALVHAELRAGNTIDELGHSHPAPPVGAYVRLGRPVSTRPRESGQGLSFYERSGSLYAGEFSDAQRFFFVLEPPAPPPAPPDMDAIRAAHAPAPAAPEVRYPDDRYVPPGAVSPEPAPDLNTVEGVQRAIVLGMKRGGTYSMAHKEGGTRISYRAGKYERSDYGDSPALYELHDDAAFLAMMFAFFRHEVSRGQAAPSELDTWRRILERMERAGTARALVPSAAAHAEVTKRLSRLHATLAVTVALLVGLALAGYRLFTIPSTGLPLGAALRTPRHVFQLIHTVERRLPSLHRAPGSDRFRIDLLAVDVRDPTHPESFTLLREQDASAINPITKILGVQGDDVVWVQALDSFAVNLRTKTVARTEDLAEANPELQLFLASARPDFSDRFVMVAPDHSYAYAFDPDTLKASMVPAPRRDTWLAEQRAGRLEASLCSGGMVGERSWLALATAESARSDLTLGTTLPRDFTASERDERTLYGGSTDDAAPRPRITESAPRSDAVYRDGVFLRASPGAGLLRAAAPDSVFVLHRPGTAPFAALSLTRLGTHGDAVWSSSTGIGRLAQVLPGVEDVVLIGERTPVPGEVPEPILVRVSLGRGDVSTTSLWR